MAKSEENIYIHSDTFMVKFEENIIIKAIIILTIIIKFIGTSIFTWFFVQKYLVAFFYLIKIQFFNIDLVFKVSC